VAGHSCVSQRADGLAAVFSGTIGHVVILGLTLVLAFCIYGAFRLSTRTPSLRVDWSGVWRLACLIAFLRISALWFGYFGFRRFDWVQSVAYIVVTLTLPEIYMVKCYRTEPFRWAMLGSAILAITSSAWAAAFFWISNRLVPMACSRREPS
jgi:hypothetical protein